MKSFVGNIGDDVGNEKASCVEDSAWPLRAPDELFEENKEVNQFIVSGGRQLLFSTIFIWPVTVT